jgi:response regulator RpfG family c-di-GMP phosphodiesterase
MMRVCSTYAHRRLSRFHAHFANADDPAIQAALEQRLIHGFIEKPFSHVEVAEPVREAFFSQEET